MTKIELPITIPLDLLRRYISHVREMEGIDYIDDCGTTYSGVQFTDEEMRLLEAISSELDVRHD